MVIIIQACCDCSDMNSAARLCATAGSSVIRPSAMISAVDNVDDDEDDDGEDDDNEDVGELLVGEFSGPGSSVPSITGGSVQLPMEKPRTLMQGR